jgi:hypothetical protein
MAKVERIDKPNMRIPLASSYNERGVKGYTNTVTNALDQRKVNVYYEVTKNALSGEAGLFLSLRPGVADQGKTYGVSSQVAQLASVGAGSNPDEIWVYNTLADAVRISNSSATTSFVSAAGYRPTYVDKTHISGVDTVVLQILNSSQPTPDQRVFYSSSFGSISEITDSNFTSLAHTGKMEHMDGYSFILDRATNKIFNSNINTVSAWRNGGTNFWHLVMKRWRFSTTQV